MQITYLATNHAGRSSESSVVKLLAQIQPDLITLEDRLETGSFEDYDGRCAVLANNFESPRLMTEDGMVAVDATLPEIAASIRYAHGRVPYFLIDSSRIVGEDITETWMPTWSSDYRVCGVTLNEAFTIHQTNISEDLPLPSDSREAFYEQSASRAMAAHIISLQKIYQAQNIVHLGGISHIKGAIKRKGEKNLQDLIDIPIADVWGVSFPEIEKLTLYDRSQ